MSKGFRKYQHVERFGTSEVQGIELGLCYIFPKLDGTNASVWLGPDGEVQAGSRNRSLSEEKDNAGFCSWAKSDPKIRSYLKDHPTHRLYGEWLVPHSLKTYEDKAWRQFYVFDVTNETIELEGLHIPYNIYSEVLEKYGINCIDPIATIENGSYESFIKLLEKNTFLIKDGEGFGEGVVIKNYEFKNRYGRQTWAKIVSNEFKERHSKKFGAPKVEAKKMVEESIANEFVTKALVDKVKAKIELDNGGFFSKNIPQLLHIVYYDVVREDCWNFVKKHKNPTINFRTLQTLVFNKIKELVPELF